MTIDASPEASDLFEKGMHYYSLDLSLILAYGLRNTPTSAVQKICDDATESYAREILNWPNGRLIKPDIFKVEEKQENPSSLDACAELFVHRLRTVFESSPPKSLPVYPHAFIVVDEEDDQHTDRVTLALAHQVDDKWKVDYCLVPPRVELGMEVESLRMGDITEQDVLDKYPTSQR